MALPQAGAVRVLLNDGAGALSLGDHLSAPESEPVVRDIDGDGLLDLTGASNNRAEIVWGTGD